MNDMIDVTAAPPVQRGRGRPPKSETETSQQRVARLQAELDSAQALLRAEMQKQFAIVGAAVMARMAKDAGFRPQIVALLRSDVTRKADRAVIAGLLAGEVTHETAL